MANSTTISPFSVTKLEDGLFNATIQIVVNDGAEDIFTKTFSKNYRTGTDLDTIIKPILRKKIKDAWDAFVLKEQQEKDIMESAELLMLCSDLQDEFNTYVNQ